MVKIQIRQRSATARAPYLAIVVVLLGVLWFWTVWGAKKAFNDCSLLAASSLLTLSTGNAAPTTLSSDSKPLLRSDGANGTPGSGWKSIDVFFGDEKHIPATKQARAQCDQDKLVTGLLNKRRGGFFVDLAANHAVIISNTYHLEQDFDWEGICVEPNPIYWRGLSYRKCHVAAAVVGSNRMEEIRFKMHDGTKRAASGGIEDPRFDNRPDRPKTNDRSVSLYTVPIMEILERYQAPAIIDYLSLDVEGAEFYVMSTFPFDKYRFRTITIERPSQELIDLMYDKNYRYVAANNEWGMETVWAHQSFLGELDMTTIDLLGWRTNSTMWLEVGKSKDEKPKFHYKGSY